MEAEKVGVSEYLPYSLWLMIFFHGKGYEIMNNIVYQDNQIAIRMEKSDRKSCNGNLRHINIRYFFVKDRVDKREVKTKYCPTQKMLANYFTKPLKKQVFKIFREVILGYKPIFSLKSTPVSIKESIRNNGKIIETL